MKVSELVDGKKRSLKKERLQLSYLDEMIENEVIKVEIVEYKPKEELPILQAADASPRDEWYWGDESSEHIRLKAIAAQYLTETGSDIVFEQEVWFGIIDVGTEARDRAAECGEIRTGKLIEAFGRESSLSLIGEDNPAYDEIDELVYIPYSQNEDYPPVTILSFQSPRLVNGS